MTMDTLNKTVTELLQLSPPVILAVALYILGFIISKSPWKNWIIPYVTVFLGGAIYPFISTTVPQVPHPTVANILYGLAIGAVPVGIDQMFKQWKSRDTDAPSA